MNTAISILKRGDTGVEVLALQQSLQKQGFFKGEPAGNFQTLTEQALVAFQFAHLGPDGKPLDADGQAGPDTLWALANPSGKPQQSGITSAIPSGISGLRLATLEVALRKHRQGTKEIPDGSNKGDGVDEIIAGFGPAPWCALFVSFCLKEGAGKYFLGSRYAHVATMWRAAMKAGLARKAGTYSPKPGDAFVTVHPNDQGHIGFVLAVESKRKDSSFNTLEGNCGNRVKCGVRSPDERHFAGYIDLFANGDAIDFTHGLLANAQRLAGAATR